MLISDDAYRAASESALRAFSSERREVSWHTAVTRGVQGNTFRSFWRIDKDKSGASEVFRAFMLERDRRASELGRVRTEDDLDELLEDWRKSLLARLTNVVPRHRERYNPVRKALDLYVVHVVAATAELRDHREKLAPLLFLPLDSDTLSIVFGIKGSMKDVRDRNMYVRLQAEASTRASSVASAVGVPFERIYFDQFWGGHGTARYQLPHMNYFLRPAERNKR